MAPFVAACESPVFGAVERRRLRWRARRGLLENDIIISR